jgi:hypothetical protein
MLTLVLHWIDYGFFLMIVEGMSFTIRPKTRYRYCITAAGDRLHTPACNAIYATLAFAGLELLLSFIAGIGVTISLQLYCYKKWKNQRIVQRIQSPGEPANDPADATVDDSRVP